ncbi:MAG: ribose 5-phosphate isomerase B [Myxococcota bacterium]
MKVAVACDHGGFAAKPRVVEEIRAAGHEVVDCGTDSPESVDYPDFAARGAELVSSGEAERAVLMCGSGVGVTIVANKFPGVRACTCHDTYSAGQGVEHDDMNVLCIGARVVGIEVVGELVRAFLGASFSGVDRHKRRLNKMLEIEAKYLDGGS